MFQNHGMTSNLFIALDFFFYLHLLVDVLGLILLIYVTSSLNYAQLKQNQVGSGFDTDCWSGLIGGLGLMPGLRSLPT